MKNKLTGLMIGCFLILSSLGARADWDVETGKMIPCSSADNFINGSGATPYWVGIVDKMRNTLMHKHPATPENDRPKLNYSFTAYSYRLLGDDLLERNMHEFPNEISSPGYLATTANEYKKMTGHLPVYVSGPGTWIISADYPMGAEMSTPFMRGFMSTLVEFEGGQHLEFLANSCDYKKIFAHASAAAEIADKYPISRWWDNEYGKLHKKEFDGIVEKILAGDPDRQPASKGKPRKQKK